MLIDEPRSKIKKIVIAFIVMNVVAMIAIVCSIILFYLQMVLIGIIAYAVSIILISCNIGMLSRFYDKIKQQEEMR